jgi:hypothetical protein
MSVEVLQERFNVFQQRSETRVCYIFIKLPCSRIQIFYCNNLIFHCSYLEDNSCSKKDDCQNMAIGTYDIVDERIMDACSDESHSEVIEFCE